MKFFRTLTLSGMIALAAYLSSAQAAMMTQGFEFQTLQALSDSLLEAKLAYEAAGNDNNSIESTTLKANRLNPALRASLQPIEDMGVLKSVLAQCVFNTKGAYGIHISPKIQSSLVEAFAQRLLSLNQKTPLKFFSSPLGLPSYSLQNFCDFVVISGNHATFVQATIMD